MNTPAAAQTQPDFWSSAVKNKNPRRAYTSDELLAVALEYFQWCNEHPLKEEKVFCFKGAISRTTISLMRPFTITGFCIFAGIHSDTFTTVYRGREDMKEACDLISSIIRTQKFEGAAANLMNPIIIARDLGLTDKHEITGAGGGPVRTVTSDMTPQEAAEAYAATLNPDQT